MNVSSEIIIISFARFLQRTYVAVYSRPLETAANEHISRDYLRWLFTALHTPNSV